MFLSPISIILLILPCVTYAKIYERCELARELRNFDLPEDEIPTWVCIAQHESDYNTSAMNPSSGDHGLFQISQLFWCSPPGDGYGCNSPCSKFRDDDIADDLQCIRRIYNEHTRISGDGFNAWVVYPLYCKNDNSQYVQGCFDQHITPDVPVNATENEIPFEEVDEYGDGYQFPSLPNISKDLLRTEQENSTTPFGFKDEYEFPKLPFSRTSIHDSVIVKENKYNFPKFPSSKQSIHEFISVQTPLEESVLPSKTEEVKQNGNSGKPPRNNIYNFPSFSSTKQSNNEFRTVHKPLEEMIAGRIKQTDQYENNVSDDPANRRYNFPIFPSTKQSIYEFTPVHKPIKETVSTNTNRIEQNENILSIKPTQGNIYNFPNFPSSKKSIHEFTSVLKKDKEYSSPTFPSSKQSIHEFISVNKPLEETIHRKSYQNDHDKKNIPDGSTYDKHSIHHFVPVSTTTKEHIKSIAMTTDKYEEKYSFPPSRKIINGPSDQSIRNIMNPNPEATKDVANEFIHKPIYTKQSIHHFVPVSTEPKNINTYKKSSEKASEYIFQLSTSTTTLKPTTILDSTNLSPLISTSENHSKISSFIISTRRPGSILESSSEKYLEIDQNGVTSTKKIFTSGLKPLGASENHYSKETSVFNKKISTSTQLPSTIKLVSSSTTLNLPFSKLKKYISSSSTSKSVPTISILKVPTSDLKTLKQSQTIVRPPTSTTGRLSTNVNIENYDIKDARSTLSPFTTFKSHLSSHNLFSKSKASTTTYKPLTTRKVILENTNPQITHNIHSKVNSFQTTISKSATTRKTSQERFTTDTTTIKPLSTFKPITITISKPISMHKATKYFNTLSTSKSFMTTSKPFTTRNASLIPFISHTTTAKPFSVDNPSITTMSKPLTTRKTPVQYFNPQTITPKTVSFLTTFKPFINKNTSFGPFSSHTTMAKPLLTYKYVTTTAKPTTDATTLLRSVKPQLSTNKTVSSINSITITSKSHKSQNKSLVPFTQRTEGTSTIKSLISSSRVQTFSTEKSFFSRLNTTVKPLLNLAYHQSSIASLRQTYTSSTTSKPSAKQVTFAPDSFFSWIFGSQTLPPLVPPVRPPRPPRPGERPGDRPGSPPQLSSPSNQRPRPPRPGGLPSPISQRPRPSGLPRPPRPPRPDLPGRIRQSVTLDGLSKPQDLADEQSDFKIPSTKRPFSERPASLSSSSVLLTTSKPLDLQKTDLSTTTISFNKKAQQKAVVTTTSKALPTTTVPRNVSLKKIASLEKEETALDGNKQFPSDTSRHNSSAARKISTISGRSEFKLNSDEHAVEVKLDDNFVLFRTRFGYRLYKNNKK